MLVYIISMVPRSSTDLYFSEISFQDSHLVAGTPTSPTHNLFNKPPNAVFRLYDHPVPSIWMWVALPKSRLWQEFQRATVTQRRTWKEFPCTKSGMAIFDLLECLQLNCSDPNVSKPAKKPLCFNRTKLWECRCFIRSSSKFRSDFF